MLQRQPLNGLQPRQVREAARDPHDWWEGPQEPAHYVIGFGGHMQPQRYLSNRPRHRLLRAIKRFVRWLCGPRP